MMDGPKRLITLLLVLVSTALTTAKECRMNDKVCEFYFEVDHRLTMMHHKDLVFPENGKIYKYDVMNTSSAEPIPTDEVITADGYEVPRIITVVNEQFPGPDIIVWEGQTVIVHVTNMLRSHAVTVHWHGLHQEGTPFMDGVPYVTQCPIHPAQSFTYEFKAKPRGTFWWHSHVGAQRSAGVFGALIIKDRRESAIEEKIMQIQDWNHDYDSDTGHMKMLYGLYIGRHKWEGAQALDGTFFSNFHNQAGLINGRGRYYHENGTHNQAPLTVYNVKQGQKYRFRVIGVGALYPFRVSVDNHELTVIASDGYDLEPTVAESFVINPGERFDFEITADKQIGNYWVRGITLTKDGGGPAEAILRYDGAAEVEPTSARRPCTEDAECLVLNCPFTYYPLNHTVCRTFDELKSLPADDPAPEFAPGKFREFFLNFAFPGITSYPGSVNGRTFHTPDVNPLTQAKEWSSPCEEPECGEGKHCKCTFAVTVGNNETVQMVFLNMGRGKGWAHPIHMHGHSFYVVKMGYGQYNATNAQIYADNEDIDCRGMYDSREESFCNDATWTNSSWLNGNVPNMEIAKAPRKDTIIVPSGGYVVIRFRADNPGLWNMHCHIELHNLDGMQMLINESYSQYPTPPHGFPECHSYPPTDHRMSLLREQAEYAKVGKEDDYQLTKGDYQTLFILLIVVIVLQALLTLVFCITCFRKKTSQNEGKYDINGKGNEGFRY